jgi:hypothetical protein
MARGRAGRVKLGINAEQSFLLPPDGKQETVRFSSALKAGDLHGLFAKPVALHALIS